MLIDLLLLTTNGWVIDLDLEKFVDRVNYGKLMGQIAKRVEDKRPQKLIRAFLNAGAGDQAPLADSSCLSLEKRIIRWPEVQIGNSAFSLNLS